MDLIQAVFACVLIVIAVAGNLLIILAVWKKPSLRSTTNYLLVNLAFSDIVSLCFLPIMFIERNIELQEGAAADFLCKFLISFHITLTASFAATCILVVLSAERYQAIVNPMKTGFRLREDTVKYTVGGCWLCAILATLPLYIYGKYANNGETTSCKSNLGHDLFRWIYILNIVLFFVVIPFFVITFCYFQIVRELYFKNKVGPLNISAQEQTLIKRKLVKLSLSITITFVVCFFPVAIAVVLSTIDAQTLYKKVLRYASALYFFEALCNPFLYAYQSTNFRQAFKSLLKPTVCN